MKYLNLSSSRIACVKGTTDPSRLVTRGSSLFFAAVQLNVLAVFAAIKIGVLAGMTFRSIRSKLIALVDAVLGYMHELLLEVFLGL